LVWAFLKQGYIVVGALALTLPLSRSTIGYRRFAQDEREDREKRRESWKAKQYGMQDGLTRAKAICTRERPARSLSL
jgi:hypothetical protein